MPKRKHFAPAAPIALPGDDTVDALLAEMMGGPAPAEPEQRADDADDVGDDAADDDDDDDDADDDDDDDDDNDVFSWEL